MYSWIRKQTDQFSVPINFDDQSSPQCTFNGNPLSLAVDKMINPKVIFNDRYNKTTNI